MHAIRPPLVSEAEFLALPETMEKVELLDGEVVMAPAPSAWHQEVLTRLVFELRSWHRLHPEVEATIGQSPFDVRFGPDRILQPDAFVLLRAVPRDHSGPLDQIPEICVEVLSTNRVHDRVTKRFVYAAAGVREYWLIEPEGPIERWSGENLTKVDVVSDRLVTELLPGFELDLSRLFA